MNRPRLLDLFCGAGGAAMGYHRAGFDVLGVDNQPQPDYPFEFRQTDAITYGYLHGHEFDAIHASPPCQGYSALRTAWNAKQHPKLVEAVRRMLVTVGRPYVIENVEGAPLHDPLRLCGSMFGLGVDGFQLRRHRLFESTATFSLRPACAHVGPVIGVYGDHARSRGHWREGADFPGRDKKKLAAQALGIDWASWHGMCQAIPPVYTEFVGAQLLRELER